MAANHPQKQLLSLIRDFATEKSQGERSFSGLRNRIQELELEIERANVDLDDVKCSKEVIEQELKGYEVELTLNEATIQALKARHSLIQDEIVKLTSDTDAIRNEEEIMRDEFLKQTLVFNKKIREFRVTQARSFNEEESKDPSTDNGEKAEDKQVLDTQLALRGLEKMLVNVISQAWKEEQDYQEVQNIHKAQLEKAELERKIFLMESVVSEMKELQELIREIRVTQARSFNEEESKDPSTNNEKKVEDKQVLDTQLALRGLEKKLVKIISQACKEEQNYQELQSIHNKELYNTHAAKDALPVPGFNETLQEQDTPPLQEQDTPPLQDQDTPPAIVLPQHNRVVTEMVKNLHQIYDLRILSSTTFRKQLFFRITVTDKSSVIKKWIMRVKHATRFYGTRIVGMHCQRAHTLQLCVRNRCIIIQLSRLQGSNIILKEFLLDKSNLFVGLGDNSTTNLKISNTLNLVGGESDNRSTMENMAWRILGMNLEQMTDPKMERADWTKRFLSKEEVEHAAITAVICYLVAVRWGRWEGV